MLPQPRHNTNVTSTPPLRKPIHVPLAGGLAPVARRRGFLRTSLAGLTPQLFVIVAVLLFARMLSANLDINVTDADALAKWLPRFFNDYLHLLVMIAPMLIIIIGTSNLGPQRGAKRVVALTAAVGVSTAVGLLLRRPAWFLSLDSFSILIYLWTRYALLAGLVTAIGEFYRREMGSIEATQQADIDRTAFEREMAEARLQVLQAQIEPHFLFNTLANARRLYDTDRPAGGRMLENLMRYLEVALPRMRDSETTLDGEVELVEAFLRIQQIRMGRQRLTFKIDVPAPLRGRAVPPMMLLTLTENAIKHGLNPAPAGGLIRVTARSENDRLMLSVADTGVGFALGSGAGIGLANIRARLAAQFGDRAQLMLANNEFGGCTSAIELPLTP